MRIGRLFAAFALCFVAVFQAGAAHAQDNYPSRTVTIIVPYAAGGVTDVLARLVAQKLTERFGQPFVIENKGGAGTIVAAVSTARAAPDGYTLMLATGSTMSINRTLYKALPYNPETELTPVALLCSVPFVLVTNPSLPVNSVGDLIKLAKEKPGRLNYGTGGVGATNAILVSLMKSMTGADMTEVSYRGTTPAIADVIAGHVQFLFSDIASVAELVKDGKLRPLGISTLKRFDTAPDIPTIAESGIPGFDGDSWQMLVAPAKTPKEIIDKLNVAITEIMASPDIRQQMIKLGMSPSGKGTPAELSAFIQSETTRWGKVVTDAGFAGTQ